MGIVVTIAVAAAWYLYTTFVATIGSNPNLRVVSAKAFTNGTVVVEVVNTGSTREYITGAYVMDKFYGIRGGPVYMSPGTQVAVYIDTGRWIRPGSIIQGRLVAESGYSVPFSARVLW